MDTIQNQVKDALNKRGVRKNIPSSSFLEHGKLPPQAIELEEAVLGALMLEKNALNAVIDILKPESHKKPAKGIRGNIKDWKSAVKLDINNTLILF